MSSMSIIFDLDDTLYLERDYVRSGFAAVGNWMHREIGLAGFGATCEGLFDAGRRVQIFQEALRLHGIQWDPTLVEALVEAYRSHQPTIRLAPDAARYLAASAGSAPLALITDGPLATQQRKVRALGLESMLDFIVYTDAFAPACGKPHPRAFQLVEAWAASTGMPLVYVADNPLKDFITPRERGWWTVQVARPERVHLAAAPSEAHEAHERITSLDELGACLESLRSADGHKAASINRRSSGVLAVAP